MISEDLRSTRNSGGCTSRPHSRSDWKHPANIRHSDTLEHYSSKQSAHPEKQQQLSARCTEEEAKALGGRVIKWHRPPRPPPKYELGPERCVKHFVCIVPLTPPNMVRGFPGPNTIFRVRKEARRGHRGARIRLLPHSLQPSGHTQAAGKAKALEAPHGDSTASSRQGATRRATKRP